MVLRRPAVVLHYLTRAVVFHRSAGDLMILDKEQHGASIGLLSVHASIALADAILAAVEADDPKKRDDHAAAARALRKWCSSNELQGAGVKHFDWLLGRKNRFSYEKSRVDAGDFEKAKVKMDQFFAWGFRTFPHVAQLQENPDE